MPVPPLQTSRLFLRTHALADFPAFAAMRADPVVMKYMGSGPIGEEDAWLKFQSMAGHWCLMGYGTWALEEKATGAVIGGIGFSDKKRPREHAASGAPEMGWMLTTSAHGNGFASEALGAALGWGREFFGPARIVCVINNDNAASIRLAERHGFRRFGHATRHGQPRLVFERNL